MIEGLAIVGTIFFVLFFFFSIWFNVYLLRKLLYFNENFGQMNSSLEEYSKHLETLYELPMFYGDENLENLINHSRELKQDMSEFQNKYSA
tara:strand:+ start:2031 stop:2303 length:273 start_codon:yes stop_codon:yes gene_type:complete